MMQSKLILIVAGALIAFLGGWYSCSVWHKAQSADELRVALEQRDKLIESERKLQEKINGVQSAHQKAIQNLNARYNAALNRLRPKSDSSMSGNSRTPREHNGTPSGNGLSWENTTAIVELMQKADLQTQQLLACQAWIREISQ